MRRSCLAAALAFILSSPAGLQARPVQVFHPESGRPMGLAGDREVLVRFKSGADRAQAVRRRGGTLREALGVPGWWRIELPSGMSVTEALRRYGLEADVAAVQPNYVYRALGIQPNDPLVSSQYGLAKIGAPAAWEIERGTSRKVTVAVLDTGIDRTHQDLAGRIDTVNWRVFCPGSGCVGACTSCAGGVSCNVPINDATGHGTQVASIIAAATDNSEGIAGVSWGATLLPIKIFDSDACADSVSLSNALAYVTTLSATQAASVGPMVVNMSIGEVPDPATAPPSCDAPADVVRAAIRAALDQNVLLVAAAGNIDPQTYDYADIQCPARVSGVVAVGATDRNDGLASFSARGAALSVVAPGADILMASPGGGYASENGTSFAAPHVSGLAALLYAALPAATTTQLRSWIFAGAEDIGLDAARQGHGRINAFRSLRLAKYGTLADFRGESRAVAFPNPYNPGQGTVAFSVPPSLQGAGLTIKVYTANGDLVRTLSGPSWDGRNEAGIRVASGVYLYLVETDKGRAKGRLAVIR